MKVLKWPGAKWALAKEILKLFPKHDVYIEPFLGSGALFFMKEPSKVELLNDIDNDVYNLFRVIRDKPNELYNSIQLTPYSEKEYRLTYERDVQSLDPVEQARQFIIRSNMARAGMQYYSSSFRHGGLVRSLKGCDISKEWSKLPEYIMQAAERIKNAEIFNRDGMYFIEKFQDKNVFQFIDTPYLGRTRRQRYYNHEMYEDEDHILFLNQIKNSKCKMLVCGYDHEIYNEILDGWHKIKINSNAEQGKKRTDTFWYNYELEIGQISMFDGIMDGLQIEG